jgi:hypothetical protein
VKRQHERSQTRKDLGGWEEDGPGVLVGQREFRVKKGEELFV